MYRGGKEKNVRGEGREGKKGVFAGGIKVECVWGKRRDCLAMTKTPVGGE